MTILEIESLFKTFGPVKALNDVSLSVEEGETMAIVGQNGAGKSTLVKILTGAYQKSSGQIRLEGKDVTISSPQVAKRLGIAEVYQQAELIPEFTVAENVVIGYPEYSSKGFVDRRRLEKAVQEMLDRYQIPLRAEQKVGELSAALRQLVAIMKVLFGRPKVLIWDEPTAVLTPQEITRLFDVLRRMKADGKSIIIITHKLHEVLSVSDRVAILRKGERVGTVETAQTSESELTEMMVGKKVSLNIERNAPVNASPRLLVRGLTTKSEDGRSAVRDVSFTVNGGEIFGIAGIAGSGQKELLEAIAGLQPVESGEIEFINPKKDRPVTFYHKSLKRVVELADKNAFHDGEGKPVSFKGMTRTEIRRRVNHGDVLFREDEVLSLRDKTPLQIRSLGIHLSFVPEDRLGMGLVGGMGITDNMMLRSYRKGHAGFVDRKKPRRQAEEIIRELEVITPGVNVPVRRLSGGNIQKVLLGREIAFTPKLLMAAYPVRGLDINSSYIIYNLLNRQKKNGVAVIFVGEDLDVLLELCDRIMVINSGAVTGIVDARTATKEEIGLLMTKTDDTAKENA